MPYSFKSMSKTLNRWRNSFDEWREHFYGGFHTTTTAAFFADLFFSQLQAEEGVIDASYSRVNQQIIFTLIFMTLNGVVKTYSEPYEKGKKAVLADGIKQMTTLKNQLCRDYDKLAGEVELLKKAKKSGITSSAGSTQLKSLAKLMDHLNKQYDKNPQLKLMRDSVAKRTELLNQYGKNYLYSFANYLSEFNRLSFGPILTLIVFNFFLQNLFEVAGTNYYISLAMADSIYLGAKALVAAYYDEESYDFSKKIVAQKPPEAIDPLLDQISGAVSLLPIDSSNDASTSSAEPLDAVVRYVPGSIDEFVVLFNQCNHLVRSIYGEYIIDPPVGVVDGEDNLEDNGTGLLSELNKLLSDINEPKMVLKTDFSHFSESGVVVANASMFHSPKTLINPKSEEGAPREGDLTTSLLG